MDLGYEIFGKHNKIAAKDVVFYIVDINNGWFKRRSEKLKPIIKEYNNLLHESKLEEGNDEWPKQSCRDNRSDTENAIEIAKGRLVENLV